jgi:hypothetical protein
LAGVSDLVYELFEVTGLAPFFDWERGPRRDAQALRAS